MQDFLDPAIVDTYIVPWAIRLVMALVIFVFGRIVVRMICGLVRKMMTKGDVDSILSDFLITILRSLLLLVVVIAALNQLGVDTTSMIALVGAAGLAVGLALQGTLSNFAAGVMLILFRPFEDGDFVEAAGVSGIIEKITIFSTIMKTGDNKQVIIPNGAIYGGTITNYSANETRRIDMVFGIGYGDDLLKAKQIVEQIMSEDSRILAEPAPGVALGELADSSVNINVRPWVNGADYWPVRADMLEKVKLAFDAQGISIPYPQMDLHVDSTAG